MQDVANGVFNYPEILELAVRNTPVNNGSIDKAHALYVIYVVRQWCLLSKCQETV